MKRLAPRERDVIALVSEGLSNKDIAYHLGLTVGTVKVYISRTLADLRLSSRFELIRHGTQIVLNDRADDSEVAEITGLA